MLEQSESILRLLGDEDAETSRLVEQQLIARGPAILADLRQLASAASGRTECRLRGVANAIERGVAEREFTECCQAFTNESDLESAAWMLAKALLPGENFIDARKSLDGWGAMLKSRLSEAETVEDQVEIITDLLAVQQRFNGNEDDYYNEENSLLPRVISTRMGIPISLVLLYMLVGRRAGLHVNGVGLPGHFIAQLSHVFFDPFHGGRRMHLDECRNLLASHGFELRPHHLLPCPPAAMLARMLNNLLRIAEDEGDQKRERLIAGWISALMKVPAARK